MAQPGPSQDEALRAHAETFALNLTETVQAAFGASVTPFTVVGRPDATVARFFVRQNEAEGIVLHVEGRPLLRLLVTYQCTWDHRGAYLAVEKSSVEVLAPASSEPLFRYDYLRNAQSVACAHLQVYAHRDAVTWAMSAAGTRSRRSKRRVVALDEGTKLPRLGDLHFPLGGARFRPCLEDVLQMLADELGVDVQPGAHTALAEGRQLWRLDQLAAAVRDAPETAAKVLEGLDYEVSRPAAGPAPDRVERLQAP